MNVGTQCLNVLQIQNALLQVETYIITIGLEIPFKYKNTCFRGLRSSTLIIIIIIRYPH